MIPVFRQQNNLYNSQHANTNLYVKKPGLNAICKHSDIQIQILFRFCVSNSINKHLGQKNSPSQY